ncbi:outer membrane lipid asymmetry maintenance protein MlaD [Coraliomargarita sinensis]|uniref:outer membrane lipid asymmetry maintenance protein MlaD n=1 Tax=Coraliomargarita sinensis TaxID=2174842 RepID=UPI001304C99D|nr:outer membrane lipid asymmetry maintenance protein MlaD [Coraliomargarita sinensis]
MNNRTIEFFVGCFVLVGLLAVFYLALQVGGARFFGSDSYELQARFSSISGVNTGSRIEIAGVPVGTVKKITLNDNYHAIATLELPNHIQLDDDTIASVRTSGLIGDRFIELSPGTSGERLVEGGTIVLTETAFSLENALANFGGGAARSIGVDSYELKARFSSINGIQSGSSVQVGGVQVGSVIDVELNDNFYAIVTLELPESLELDDDTIASVKTAGLIGGRFIELSPGGSGFALEPGDMIVDTESALDIENLISKFALGGIDKEEN